MCLLFFSLNLQIIRYSFRNSTCSLRWFMLLKLKYSNTKHICFLLFNPVLPIHTELENCILSTYWVPDIMLSFSYSISVSPHLNYTSKNRYYLTFIDKENEDSEDIPYLQLHYQTYVSHFNDIIIIHSVEQARNLVLSPPLLPIFNQSQSLTHHSNASENHLYLLISCHC